MTSDPGESAHAAPWGWVAAKVTCAVVAGGLTALFLQLGMAVVLLRLEVLLAAMYSRLFLVPAILAIAWLGPAFLIGGAVARLVAGGYLREGRAGAAGALALLFVLALSPAFGCWGFKMTLEEPLMPIMYPMATVRDYTALMQFGTTVIGTALAWHSDRWVLRRLRRER